MCLLTELLDDIVHETGLSLLHLAGLPSQSVGLLPQQFVVVLEAADLLLQKVYADVPNSRGRRWNTNI